MTAFAGLGIDKITGVESLVLALRVLLGAVFATAGVAKLRDPEGSRNALQEFGLPAPLARPGGVLLPLAEIAIAVALLFPPTARWGAIAAAVLLALFVAAIANAMAHGRAPDCHCFGQVHSEPAGRSTLVRNGVLIAIAAVVAVAGSGAGDRRLDLGAQCARNAERWPWCSPPRRPSPIGFADVVSRRRFCVRFETKFGSSGLPIGSPAPDFTLSETGGGERSLEELCVRGLPVVLVFVSPTCGPCLGLLPRLATWHERIGAELTFAVVSTGSVEANEPLKEEYGFNDLLVEERADTYSAYGLGQGTPSAVVVDPDRTIASVGAAGNLAIEALIRITLRRAGSPVYSGQAA